MGPIIKLGLFLLAPTTTTALYTPIPIPMLTSACPKSTQGYCQLLQAMTFHAFGDTAGPPVVSSDTKVANIYTDKIR